MSTRKNDNRKLFTSTDHSELYQRYRPTYPSAVYASILDYLANSSNSSTTSESAITSQYKLAVDIACGTGQSTLSLTPHFAKVIGCDVSKSQIDEAKRHYCVSNLEFCVAPAEEMPFLSDGSVDLVTCAAAFHWLDHEKTYREIKRILRRGGVFAIYSYSPPRLAVEAADRLVQEFWDTTLKPFYSPQIYIALNHCHDVHPPFADVTRKEGMAIEQDIPLSSFIGFQESCSPYQTLLTKQPNSQVLQTLSDRLKAVYSPDAAPTEDPIVHVLYPVYIVMCRNN